MKHIRLYEDQDILNDLEKIGYKPYVGFIYYGVSMTGGNNSSIGECQGFLVQAKDEKRCANIIAQAFTKFHTDSNIPTSYIKNGENGEYNSVGEYITELFTNGHIIDSGVWGKFKAKNNVEEVILIQDPYNQNPGFTYNLAKEHFTNYEEIFEKNLPFWMSKKISSGEDKLRNWKDKYNWK